MFFLHVLSGEEPTVCRSDDGGETWTEHAVATATILTSNAIWNGSEFRAWEQGRGFRSADGIAWEEVANDPPSAHIGPVAISPDGTYVAAQEQVREARAAGYETQVFYRSTDGIHWATLAPESYVHSHPIREITFGYAEASALCRAE